MSDYSTWKVADLKAELKRRDISQTGLRLKQQFIDKLVENDNSSAAAGGGTSATESGDTVEGEEQAQKPETHAPTTEEKPEESQEVPPSKEAPPSQEAPPAAQGEGEKGAEEEKAAEAGATDTKDAAAEGEGEGATESKRGEADEEQTVEKPKADAPTDTATESKPEATAEPVSGAEPEARDEPPAEPAEQAPPAPAPAPAPSAQDSVPAAPDGEKAEDTTMAEAPSQETTAADGQPEQGATEGAPEQPARLGTDSSISVPPDEALEDARKRRRRSQTPAPTFEDVARKKAKTERESPRVILQDDAGAEEPPQDVDSARRTSASEEVRSKKPVADARFKNLFAAPEPEPVRATSPPGDTAMNDAEVEPAVHAATAALYIDGLMRPLQPVALRNHLASLASSPGDSPNADVVQDFYLDPIKTHCFAKLSGISAASRVRSALHGTVWPNERNRKTLFVDFIPEDKLREWVDTEEDAKRRNNSSTRWEVKYESTPDGTEAVLREVDPKASAPATTMRPPPTGPRASFANREPPSGPRADARSRPGHGFKALDELFKSTTTKPKLYYQPVPREVVDRRLDRFDDLIRKGPVSRRGGSETRRISFEDTDYFVDNGPEYGGGGRGNRRRRRGGRGGGFGDSWRRDRY